ncbi:cleavage polyadenylation factor subunit fip1, partial [Ascosphaera aggregata]
MDDSDEDLYGPSEGGVTAQADRSGSGVTAADTKPDEEEVEEYEEVEDDDTTRVLTLGLQIRQARHAALRGDTLRQPVDTTSLSKQQQQQHSTAAAAQSHHANVPARRPDTHISTPSALKPTGPQKPGSAYPAIHASNIDVNANPIYPAANKPILSVNLDEDIPGDDKPWRKPGTDLSDYFNYGFDEFTWATYCLKQQETQK